MADYWKSQPRKFCDFCKCWIADNKPSRDFHERGKRHQENVAKRISELRKKGFEHARNEKDAAKWMIEMEKEALKKLREDLSTDPSLAAQYGVKIKSRSEEEDKPSQPPSTATGSHWKDVAAGEWQEALSEDGYVYYWNSETGESRWELPASDDSPVEIHQPHESNEETLSAQNTKTSEKPEKSEDFQDQKGSSLWQQLSSPEGYPYYWNTQTGEVSWEMPSAFDGHKGQPPSEDKGLMETAAVKESSDSDSKEIVVTEAAAPTSLVTENSASEPEPVVETAEFSRKRAARAVYGEWQEMKEECKQQVDLELPTNQNKTEVETIVLSKEPKVLFKEKTIGSLGPRGTEHKAVEFKKRKLNSGAAKGNIRRTNNYVDS